MTETPDTQPITIRRRPLADQIRYCIDQLSGHVTDTEGAAVLIALHMIADAAAGIEAERAAAKAAAEGLYENWAVGYTDLYGDQHHVQYGAEQDARDHLGAHGPGAVLQRRWQTDWATVYPRRDDETRTT
ncbi:hypothetical protein [Actinocrinis sp.]|uniref:hypothetical protein n=1 Tax=Actinocrinis sp. TaxID=1920516 RepID=UPI002D61CCA8|nr:hypothetical protein [Actinocrinis sp.]HZP53877.1 hypothetical protein [Actinocrinis sp.]